MTKTKERGVFQEIQNAEMPANDYVNIINYPKDAEKVNGRWAMLGLVALFGAYS
mgnify:CR=1 FL=1